MLLPHGLIEDRIEKLAADIRADLPGVTPHLLVVLKGGSEFATDLTRAMRKKHAYAGSSSTHLPFTVDYIRVKSYEGTESTGNGERRGGCCWVDAAARGAEQRRSLTHQRTRPLAAVRARARSQGVGH